MQTSRSTKRRTVLVTGAASGIGELVARRLLDNGYAVIASARSHGQLRDLVQYGAEAIAMDVGSDESVAACFEQIAELDAAIHCAAVAPLGTVEFTSPSRVGEVININTLGALRILQASLPLLRQSQWGRLLLVSSLWGRASGPFVSSYAASKHAIEAIADSARRETRGQGVHISVIEPGVVKTPMYFKQTEEIDRAVAVLKEEESRLYGELYANHRKLVTSAEKSAITAHQCAEVIERCLYASRPKPRYRAGLDAKAMAALSWFLTDRGLDRVFSRMYPARG